MNLMVLLLGEIAEALGADLPDAFMKFRDKMFGIKDPIQQGQGELDELAKKMKDLAGLTDEEIKQQLHDGLVGPIKDAADAADKLKNKLASLPSFTTQEGKDQGVEFGGGFQHGGLFTVRKPTSIIVGEAGPETVVVLRNPQEGTTQESGSNITINLSIQSLSFDEVFARNRLVPMITDVLRRYTDARDRFRRSLGGS